MSGRSSPRRSPQASINQAFDEENSEDLDQNERQLRTSSPSTSDSKSHSNRGKAYDDTKKKNESLDMSITNTVVIGGNSQCRHAVGAMGADNTSTPTNKLKSESASPKNTHKPVNKMSSEESLLSGAGSLVIEESASSGGESSPGSGIYKNIIINLGGIMPQDYNDLSQDVSSDVTTDRLSKDKKVNNIGSKERTTTIGTGQQSPDIRTQRQQKWYYFLCLPLH